MIRSSSTLAVLGSVAVALATAAASARAEQAGPAATPSPSACAAGSARSFDDVLGRVRGSTRASAVSRGIAAASALEQQAGARPNPEIGLEVEDFTGSGEFSSFGESQTTLSVSQRFELGGKRAERREVAARETGAEKARGAQEIVRTEVAARQAYVALLAARARRGVSARGEGLAREVLADARRRAEGGAGSSPDVERASIAAATALLAVSEADRQVDLAQQRLASLWGGRASEASCIAGELAQLTAKVPPAQDREKNNPAVAIAEAEVDLRRAEVAKAQADVVPDLAVAAGVRHLAGPDEVSVVTGFVVEVPIFDRNAGNVRAAEERLFAAQDRARLAHDEAAGRVARLEAGVDAARERAAMLQQQAIPAAERAYAALARAWQGGAVSSLEVLDARRSLVDLRLQHVDALAELHSNAAALEGATGAVGTDSEDAAADAPASAGAED